MLSRHLQQLILVLAYNNENDRIDMQAIKIVAHAIGMDGADLDTALFQIALDGYATVTSKTVALTNKGIDKINDLVFEIQGHI